MFDPPRKILVPPPAILDPPRGIFDSLPAMFDPPLGMFVPPHAILYHSLGNLIPLLAMLDPLPAFFIPPRAAPNPLSPFAFSFPSFYADFGCSLRRFNGLDSRPRRYWETEARYISSETPMGRTRGDQIPYKEK